MGGPPDGEGAARFEASRLITRCLLFFRESLEFPFFLPSPLVSPLTLRFLSAPLPAPPPPP